MRNLVGVIADWSSNGNQGAIARTISVLGFGGRREGEALAVRTDGEIAGSPLGGSANASLLDAVSELTADHPGVVLEVPVGDREAVAAGLACGGLARILLQDAGSLPSGLWARLAGREPVVLVTPLPMVAGQPLDLHSLAIHFDDGDSVVIEGSADLVPGLRTAAVEAGAAMLRSSKGATRLLEDDGSEVFLEAFVPPSRVVLVAEPSDLARAINAQAELLGWETTTHDEPAEALTAVDALGPRDALVVLSHNHDLDTPALAAGISRHAYVGALGSRHTQQRRREQLAGRGFEEEAISRIHGPIGLDIGSRTPEETALAIFGEILAWRSGRNAHSLREGDGPIHG